MHTHGTKFSWQIWCRADIHQNWDCALSHLDPPYSTLCHWPWKGALIFWAGGLEPLLPPGSNSSVVYMGINYSGASLIRTPLLPSPTGRIIKVSLVNIFYLNTLPVYSAFPIEASPGTLPDVLLHPLGRTDFLTVGQLISHSRSKALTNFLMVLWLGVPFSRIQARKGLGPGGVSQTGTFLVKICPFIVVCPPPPVIAGDICPCPPFWGGHMTRPFRNHDICPF